MSFQEFPKIARLTRECIITEKIDGTNALVHIASGADMLAVLDGIGSGYIAHDTERDLYMLAGSRTKYIVPAADNHGFARWVHEHSSELWTLGEGRHYGEWWGSGIQRGYGLPKGEKRFSLFNTSRWVQPCGPLGEKQEYAPSCCHVVPVLLQGLFSTERASTALEHLRTSGSHAAPGFMKPEGIVVYHVAGNVGFKKTLEKDDAPKSGPR